MVAIRSRFEEQMSERRTNRVVLGVVASVIVVTVLHYLTGANFLPYHTMYRSLYYLPIAVAAIMWGLRGGLLVSLLISALYLPHILLLGEAMPGGIVDNLLEVLTFNFVAALAGVLSDAQHRHQQQAAQLRTYIDDVLASLPVGVATVDHAGVVEPRNPAGVALLDGVDGSPFLPATPGYAEQELGERPVGVRSSTLHGVDGSTIGQVMVLEDLTEQRRLQEQVRQAERLAALGQLAGGLAHEVRNPLAIVRATAQVLATRVPPELGLERYTDVLTGETDRIERLIGELLAYAHPRSPQFTRCDPAGLAQEVSTAVAGYAEQHEVTIITDAPSTAPPVSADREQLRQALLNLLLNAVQVSPAGAEVHLSCSSSAGQVHFTIQDHGPGIPTAIRSRIFDPFFTTRDDGVGMGLAVVARIVADHDGTIDVRDIPGGGTCAILTLQAEQHR
jgi:two-component system sensor histidine kinase AtoS